MNVGHYQSLRLCVTQAKTRSVSETQEILHCLNTNQKEYHTSPVITNISPSFCRWVGVLKNIRVIICQTEIEFAFARSDECFR